MDENVNINWLGIIIALLPYEIGLLFMLFGSATLIQVVFFGTLSYFAILAFIAFFRNPKDVILLLIIGSKL